MSARASSLRESPCPFPPSPLPPYGFFSHKQIFCVDLSDEMDEKILGTSGVGVKSTLGVDVYVSRECRGISRSWDNSCRFTTLLSMHYFLLLFIFSLASSRIQLTKRLLMRHINLKRMFSNDHEFAIIVLNEKAVWVCFFWFAVLLSLRFGYKWAPLFKKQFSMSISVK